MVAAEKIELDGITSRALELCELKFGLRYSAKLRLGDLWMIVAVNGPGPKLASEAVESVCSREAVDAIVNTGFCGGLHPSLAVGDIVIADEITAKGKRYAAKSPQGPVPKMHGTMASQDRVAVSAEEKQRLAESGAMAVEMEAAGVAEQAERRGLAFYCVRAVSDTAEETMPLDFNDYRDSGGRFDRKAIAIAAMMHPFRRIPALRQLQRDCQFASAKLGGFLADCRF